MSRKPKGGYYYLGDYIQIYTDGKPKPYYLESSDRSPRQGGGLGVGPICKRGSAARTTTDRDATPLANLIRGKKVYSYLTLLRPLKEGTRRRARPTERAACTMQSVADYEF